jgi:hypothetical protein
MPKTNYEALSHKQWYETKDAIRNLRSRALMHLRHGLTAEDLFHAFVKEEDKEPMRRIFDICDVNVSQQAMGFITTLPEIEANGVAVDVKATFSITLPATIKFKFLFPRYMLVSSALTKASPGFEAMLRQMVQISFEWAQVYQVFYYLNKVCTSPAQIQAVCPAFGMMLAEHPHTQRLGEKLKNHNGKSFPAMPRELRQMAYNIRATIAKSLITPIDTSQPHDEVGIGISSATTAAKLPWGDGVWLVLPGND